MKLRHNGRSPGVVRALTDFGAEQSFGRAAKQFQEHYGYEVGRTSVLRLVESVALETEDYVEARLANAAEAYALPVAERPGVCTIVTQLDGCEIRTGTLQPGEGKERTAVRNLPKRKRVEAWRDVRTGFARELNETERTYVAGMKDYGTMGQQLFQAAVDRGLSDKTQVVSVADGGNGLREQLDEQFPDQQFILDRPHFKQHLYETAEEMGLVDGEREAWVRENTDLCECGRVADVIDTLRGYTGPGEKRAIRLANYLSRFSDAVHYEKYREAGYPTGSGEVESAHRYIPQKRLKLPGACWHPDTINPMLSLRVMRENGWWQDFWEQRRSEKAA